MIEAEMHVHIPRDFPGTYTQVAYAQVLCDQKTITTVSTLSGTAVKRIAMSAIKSNDKEFVCTANAGFSM